MSNIDFLEKPATSDEFELVTLLEIIVKAFETKDANLLAPIYANDALIITIRSGKKIFNKKEYIQNMTETMQTIERVRFENVLIRAADNEADVFSTIVIFLSGKGLGLRQERHFKCKKVSNSWRIFYAKPFQPR